ELMVELGRVEALSGNPARAVEYFREGIRLTPPNQRGLLITLYCVAAIHSARSGNFDAADGLLQECLRLHRESLQWRDVSPDRHALWDGLAASAQSAMYQARGRFQEAEKLRRECIEAWAREAHTGPGGARDRMQQAKSDLALLLARQGRLLEAESVAREVLTAQLQTQGRNSPRTAITLRTLITVIAEQGRYAEAETLAREVVDIYQRSGAPA